MPTLSPRWAAYVAIAFGVIGFIGTGTVPLPRYIPSGIATDITQTCVWLAAIGQFVTAYLHLNTPPVAGPLFNARKEDPK